MVTATGRRRRRWPEGVGGRRKAAELVEEIEKAMELMDFIFLAPVDISQFLAFTHNYNGLAPPFSWTLFTGVEEELLLLE